MSKRELIDAIIEFNRSAAPEFLARFNEDELKAYLERVRLERRAESRIGVVATVDAGRELQVA